MYAAYTFIRKKTLYCVEASDHFWLMGGLFFSLSFSLPFDLIIKSSGFIFGFHSSFPLANMVTCIRGMIALVQKKMSDTVTNHSSVI